MSHTLFLPSIIISFAPAWWNHFYGMVFDRLFWQDPIARTERQREQQRLLYDRFGDIGLGERDPKPRPKAGDAYGHRFMSVFWSCEISYIDDQYPSAVVLPDALEQMQSLEVPSISNSPAVQQLYKEVTLLQERYGACEAVINFGGPLNNAVSVFGAEIYTACKLQPELARSVLQKMGEAVLVVHEHVVCPLNNIPPAVVFNQNFEIGNCPVGTVSPAVYRDVVRPVDMWLRRKFYGKFGLHHCGIFEPYAEVYRPLMPDKLDVGPGTDLYATRLAYPDTPITTYLEVGALASISREDLDSLIVKLIADALPTNLFPIITVAEAGPEVSDETVRNLMTLKERIL
jgi:hypothetical protein